MIPLETKFKVIDKNKGRWGTVTLKWKHGNTISGYLDPEEEEYKKVREIFNNHSNITSGIDNLDEAALKISVQNILDLGVWLVDKLTNEKYKPKEGVYIDENMLLTVYEEEQTKI